MGVTSSLLGAISNTISSISNTIARLSGLAGSPQIQNLPAVEAARNAASSVIGGLSDAFKSIPLPGIDVIDHEIKRLLTHFEESTLNPVFSTIGGKLGDLFNSAAAIPGKVLSGVEPFLRGVVNKIEDTGNALKSNFFDEISTVSGKLEKVGLGLLGTLGAGVDDIKDVFSKGQAAVAGALGDSVKFLSSEVTKIKTVIDSTVKNAFDNIKPLVSDISAFIAALPTDFAALADKVILAFKETADKPRPLPAPGTFDIGETFAVIARIFFE